MPLLAGSIYYQDVHPGLGLIGLPSFRQRLSEILVFILTLISACRRMSSGLSQVDLPSCVSCAAFVDLFRRWLLPLY